MDAVEFRADSQNLERFARDILRRTVTIEELSPFERRMRWDSRGSGGVSSSTRLRSGLSLSATKLRWERPWAFRIHEAATPLKFNLGRGAGPRMTPLQGSSHMMGRGILQVRHAAEGVSTTCEFLEGAAECEQLALEIEPARLRELCGTQMLPRALERLLSSSGAYVMHEQPMTPALFQLLDEILHCDARGSSRQLLLEAKGLELLAVLVDELELASQELAPFGQRDLERLERARRIILERMTAPPSLPELARHVGLNEVKLKTGFRMLFGSSVFAYLRAHRLETARRLLIERRLTVTEVAVRVGYENPSKFAAAFRKQFGMPPSDLR